MRVREHVVVVARPRNDAAWAAAVLRARAAVPPPGARAGKRPGNARIVHWGMMQLCHRCGRAEQCGPGECAPDASSPSVVELPSSKPTKTHRQRQLVRELLLHRDAALHGCQRFALAPPGTGYGWASRFIPLLSVTASSRRNADVERRAGCARVGQGGFTERARVMSRVSASIDIGLARGRGVPRQKNKACRHADAGNDAAATTERVGGPLPVGSVPLSQALQTRNTRGSSRSLQPGPSPHIRRAAARADATQNPTLVPPVPETALTFR